MVNEDKEILKSKKNIRNTNESSLGWRNTKKKKKNGGETRIFKNKDQLKW